MYERIVGDNPYDTPMMIYPASHYTMGGLWVDYNLMSNIPGLHVLGEANFSDHGANRLGASALMQGLADGYFVIPYTIGDFLANNTSKLAKIDSTHPEFKKSEEEVKARINRLLSIKGKKTPTQFHKELGNIMWNNVGMGRNEKGLKEALKIIPEIREEFWKNLNVPGEDSNINTALERANRVADFLEFAEVLT